MSELTLILTDDDANTAQPTSNSTVGVLQGLVIVFFGKRAYSGAPTIFKLE